MRFSTVSGFWVGGSRGYYEAGLWTAEMVRNAAHNPNYNSLSTEEEAEEIIGEAA